MQWLNFVSLVHQGKISYTEGVDISTSLDFDLLKNQETMVTVETVNNNDSLDLIKSKIDLYKQKMIDILNENSYEEQGSPSNKTEKKIDLSRTSSILKDFTLISNVIVCFRDQLNNG